MTKKTENCRAGSDERRVVGTKEWSDSSVNIQVGCEHDCLYCYAHEQIDRTQHSRVDGAWASPRQCPAKVKKGYRLRRRPDGSPQTLMFPTSHDITPRNIEECVTVLKKLAQAGIRDNPELIGILNSGHNRRVAAAVRLVGDTFEPTVFSTWAAKVIASIGKLPGTLAMQSSCLSSVCDTSVVRNTRGDRRIDSFQNADERHDSRPFWTEWSVD